MDLQRGDVCVHNDEHFQVIWNGSATFQVYDNVENGQNEIDVFTVNGVTNSSDAIWYAKDYIDNLHKEISGGDAYE